MLLDLIGYAASLVMGLALGITGGGGSILTVPILVYLFHVSPTLAATYSLIIVGLVAAWGAWNAYRNAELNVRLWLSFGIPGVLGVMMARRFLVPSLPDLIPIGPWILTKDSLLLLAFSILMLLAANSMIRNKATTIKTAKPQHQQLPLAKFILSGLTVGTISGFVGAGGGFLIVPALVHLTGSDMKTAIGTSLMIIATQSLLGSVADIRALEQLNPMLLATVMSLAMLGMSIGVAVKHRLPSQKLKIGFGYFVLIMGIGITLMELMKGISS